MAPPVSCLSQDGNGNQMGGDTKLPIAYGSNVSSPFRFPAGWQALTPFYTFIAHAATPTLEEHGPFKPYAPRPFSSRAGGGPTRQPRKRLYVTDPWNKLTRQITNISDGGRSPLTQPITGTRAQETLGRISPWPPFSFPSFS